MMKRREGRLKKSEQEEWRKRSDDTQAEGGGGCDGEAHGGHWDGLLREGVLLSQSSLPERRWSASAGGS